MQHTLTMRYPAAWHGDMWREGAPFGSGIVGGLVYGSLWKEYICINHAKLWRGGKNSPLPDVHDRLPLVRQYLDDHNPREADRVLTTALREAGYDGDTTFPSPVCDIRLSRRASTSYRGYRREIHMDTGVVSVAWREGDAAFCREVFASRKSHLVYLRYTAQHGTIDTRIWLELHDPETLGKTELPAREASAAGAYLTYAARNDSVYMPGDYGAVAKITTDGTYVCENGGLSVTGARTITLVLRVFLSTPREIGYRESMEVLDTAPSYEAALSAHIALHRPLFSGVDFSISDPDTHRTNDELLADAQDNGASAELIEKLYAYGRYLFLSSTGGADMDTLPCHLIGLFNGTYQCFWAIYMYNVNFEMIYWNALSGGMFDFLRLALDYTESMLEDFRENAKKLFGCRGIWINSVNTPESGLCKCLANHIVNWTGGAAWFGQHFWDYYRFTGDESYLREHVMPYLYEVALFYEDFAVENADGYYDLYPSTSPENTPQNVWDENGCNIETVKNASMEHALLREVLTHLLEGARITGLYADKVPQWEKMRTKCRPCRINDDGAIAEWLDPCYVDHYAHRHHSHLYPVFPGSEVSVEDPLYPAFCRAEELRISGGHDGTIGGAEQHSSWGMANMAGEAARLRRGNTALWCLSEISRACLMGNFFTTHNDWRRMGSVCCEDCRPAPYQIDGNIGIPAAVNEMLFQSQMAYLTVLPALPDDWTHGYIHGIRGRDAVCCAIDWNEDGGIVRLTANTPVEKEVRIGSGYRFADGSDRTHVMLGNEERTLVFYKA
ncbi:MAG: glycoside hydrolase N-terminal domain-containing protein [Eubacteriales bacterium]|nr:glycoside hydrolase N-terminal domain-containing protein [Eubacteriales bacterium]